MASPAQLLYDDDNDTPVFAARRFPGCFTIDQAQARLGRSVRLADLKSTTGGQKQRADSNTAQHHFLPGCICSPLHEQCGKTSAQQGVGNKIRFTPEQLRLAGEAGCLFCQAIYGGIREAPPWDPTRKTPTPMLPSFELNSARWDGQDTGIMLFQPTDPPLMIYCDKNVVSMSPCRLFRLRENLPSTTDIHDMVSYIQQANRSCHAQHSCDSDQDPSFKPTRLVRVNVKDGEYEVKLVQGSDAQAAGRYLTLSHCWGTNMPSSAKTLASTLNQQLTSISWDDLTPTFRDAVAMTERLGYSHIWIDSLCIIQDSKADWEAEAATMALIYANCDLMLSVDGAASGDVGFFRSAVTTSQPWKPTGVEGTALGAVRFAYIKSHRTFNQMVQMFTSPDEWAHLCPLDSRAWCYQERRLAPRIIHFGMDELHWDCLRGGHCQCGAFGDIPFPTDRAQMHKLATTTEGITRQEKELQWDLAITNYSERSLTFWTDRLPAMSGLAQKFLPHNDAPRQHQTDPDEKIPFSHISLGTYLAGLWSFYLPRGLCWYADYRPGKQVSPSKSDGYIAPSWSWMSISGHVQVIVPAEFEPAAEILSAKCHPLSSTNINPTWAISSGEVVLRAKIIPLEIFRGVVGRTERWAYLHAECDDPSVPGKRVCPGTYRPDVEPPMKGSLGGATFFAGANYWLDDPDVKGEDLERVADGEYFGVHMAKMFIMVVKPVEREEGTYERVGSIFRTGFGGERVDKSLIFEGAEERVLRLI